MKKLALFLCLAAFTGSAKAGPLVALPAIPLNQVLPAPLFRDQELFADIYGSYLKAYESDSYYSDKHEGWGGGFAIGHYFGYYIGARGDLNFSSVSSARTNVGGDVLLRYPIAETHLAPYIFVGGGVVISDGDAHGFIRAGGGLEYRFTPHFGIFSEVSYAWLNTSDLGDNLTVKAGIRLVY